MRRRQLGMTFIGLLCILAMVGIIGYAGVRLLPLYLNYMKVTKTMSMTAEEVKGENADPGKVRGILERHWEVEDPTDVDYKDIEITKDESGIVMHVAYNDSADFIANVSLAVHFDHTQKVQ